MTWGRGSTRAWRRLRAEILHRDPTCQLRLAGCTGASTEVDHIVNIAAGGTNARTNLRGVCAACHRAKTLSEAAAGRHRPHHPREPHPNTARGRDPQPANKGHRNV